MSLDMTSPLASSLTCFNWDMVLLSSKRPMRCVSLPSSQAPGDRALAVQVVIEALGNLKLQVLEWHLLMQQLWETSISDWSLTVTWCRPVFYHSHYFWHTLKIFGCHDFFLFFCTSLAHSTSQTLCLIHFIFITVVLLKPGSWFPQSLMLSFQRKKTPIFSQTLPKSVPAKLRKGRKWKGLAVQLLFNASATLMFSANANLFIGFLG